MQQVVLKRFTTVVFAAFLVAGIGHATAWHVAAAWIHHRDGGYEAYYWNTLSNPKFRYEYGTGQWGHYSSIGSAWYAISATGQPEDDFIGDGSYHNLGNGFWYQWVLPFSTDYGYWSTDGADSGRRYEYSYATGRWAHKGYTGEWFYLGNAGLTASFMGDGAYHNLGNGFTYAYLAASDSGWFLKGSAGRLRYLYAPGQWRNYSSYGGWQNLGNAGLSASFMGDGSYHNLGNGFWYQWVLPFSTDYGYWSTDGADSGRRYEYSYATGRWAHKGYTGEWFYLGNAGLTASFMGDGAYHNLGNGFTYAYLAASDSGWFLKGSAGRFSYLYAPGQWRNYSSYGGWQNLGIAGLSASFMGDGSYHNLGNGFTYAYLAASDSGWFLKGSAGRLSYLYAPGQWRNYSSYGGWQNLGIAGLSASFMGDGAYHNLGNGFTYAYLAASDSGWFLKGSAGRLRYLYAPGQWRNYSSYGGWQNLGIAGLSASFMGDGAYHNLGNGFTYAYLAASDSGWFLKGSAGRFSYLYAPGQWRNYSSYGGWQNLGNAGLSASFMGDGSYHNLGNGFWYQWVLPFSTDYGYWSTDGADSGRRYEYSYATGRWAHKGYTGEWFYLGNAGLTASFMGDGIYHDLGLPGGWQYAYGTSENKGWWKNAANHQFGYTYGDGQWWDCLSSEWGRLGQASRSVEFIADGQSHQFGGIDYFLYDGSYYYWRTGNKDHYRYEYATEAWWQEGGGSWIGLLHGEGYYDHDVRNIGPGTFVIRFRYADFGDYAPEGFFDIRLLNLLSRSCGSHELVTRYRGRGGACI